MRAPLAPLWLPLLLPMIAPARAPRAAPPTTHLLGVGPDAEQPVERGRGRGVRGAGAGFHDVAEHGVKPGVVPSGGEEFGGRGTRAGSTAAGRGSRADEVELGLAGGDPSHWPSGRRVASSSRAKRTAMLPHSGTVSVTLSSMSPGVRRKASVAADGDALLVVGHADGRAGGVRRGSRWRGGRSRGRGLRLSRRRGLLRGLGCRCGRCAPAFMVRSWRRLAAARPALRPAGASVSPGFENVGVVLAVGAGSRGRRCRNRCGACRRGEWAWTGWRRRWRLGARW